ncbi:hypothetical protein [Nannocystis pusilla]|uniref:hypothetical protein n=1 Tax=Nannocystis pusilla TaxID=889268 RepID=UPI003B829DB4
MLKSTIEGDGSPSSPGLAEELKIGYEARLEPKLPFETSWVQERANQLAILDTFFGALSPESSYASSTPSGRPSSTTRAGCSWVWDG